MRPRILELATALVIAQCLPGVAGYEFSISASSTDPHENVATPTNGRNLYLWATCIDDGLSNNRRLIRGAFSEGRSSWSPDARQLVYERYDGRTNRIDLWVFSLESGTSVPLFR